MKILIVEDDENSRVLLTSVLSAAGHKVTSVGNGVKAIGHMENNLPDLIISDILMPEMDGYALCKRLKADSRFCRIPFVFYTATYTDPQDKKFALDMGASAFWIKPMEVDQLIREMEDLMAALKQFGDTAEPLSPIKEHALDFDYKKILAKKLDKKVRDLDIERQKLQASENRFKRIVEALREKYFFYTHDADGQMTYISPSAAIMLGYPEQELLAHYTTFLTASEVNKNARQCKQMILEGRKVPAYEIEMVHKDGTSRMFKITEEPLYDENGKVVFVEGIAHDITEERFLEARIRRIHKMEALGTLAGGIAHDFNNILFSIMANANMIERRVDKGSEIASFVKMIRTAGKRAQSLTSQISTYLRKGREDKKDVYLQKIINEVFELVRPVISPQISFEVAVDDTCSPIFADPSQIHQVIMNLCTNSAQAIGDQLGKISVSLKEIEITGSDLEIGPGAYLELIVADTGQGIGATQMEKIFDPYYTTKEKGEGTGLGLSLVHGIITGLGGYVTVKSEPEQGAEFLIYLPVTG